MATKIARVEDVITSIQYIANDFALANNLEFADTSSVEAANDLIQQSKNLLILVFESLKQETFSTFSFRLFVSFASEIDANSSKTGIVLASFMSLLPRFSRVIIYDADGLRKPVSEFYDTGVRFVVQNIVQKQMSKPQMRNNLLSIEFTLLGLANKAMLQYCNLFSKLALDEQASLRVNLHREILDTAELQGGGFYPGSGVNPSQTSYPYSIISVRGQV